MTTIRKMCLISMIVSCSTFAKPIDFNRDIRPILSDRCFHCHGPAESGRKADLRLDTLEGLIEKVVVPGNAAASELIKRVTSKDPDERMPPEDAGDPLEPQQIQLLKSWIDQGAKWEQHWAFVRPVRPDRPKVNDDAWPVNEIDYLVLKRLEDEGLSPSEPAAKERLIRRVTLDLTGLPPTADEVDAFLNDKSKNAYEKVVDRLLASSKYGERMAWNWLEVSRYADSNGYQGDRTRTMWPWRDWVVKAFNDNLPFDDFTIMQLAGDLKPDASLEDKLATGFCRNHMINGEGGRIAEENRVDYIFDQLETMGTVWLGITFNCARCHDHKYDPFKQNEYYQLFAFFNQTPVNGGGSDPQTAPNMPVVTDEQRGELDQLQSELKSARDKLNTRKGELAKGMEAWEKSMTQTHKPAWKPITPIKGSGIHQSITILDNHRVVAGGPVNPPKDTYTIEYRADAGTITGLKLEALKHESIKQGGLSRSASGNFVLTELEVQVIDIESDKPHRLSFADATASYEQGSFPIKNAFDGKPSTGWAVHKGKYVTEEHHATLKFKSPAKVDETSIIRITLRHDSQHVNHNLNCFRFLVTDSPTPLRSKQDEKFAKALAVPQSKRNAEQKKIVSERYYSSDPDYGKLNQQVAAINGKITAINKSLPKVMIMQDMPNKRKTFKLSRGLYNKPTEVEVNANVPLALPPLPSTDNLNRLDLATWLVRADHPLTSRVTVNRYWQLLFGIGLVKTSEDFGTQGELPPNQPLLDWLAVDFVESGWDLKRLVRLIVTSNTYRQTSRANPDAFERDPENRLFARGPRFRMPSWMLRDVALASGGLLIGKEGGPPVMPYQPQGVWAEATFGKKKYVQDQGDKLYRRSLYTFWRRIVGPTMFFDAATRQFCEVKQARTNTPLHALTTLNDISYVEAARSMAQRLLQTKGINHTQRIRLAFRWVLSREPKDAETQVLLNAIDRLKKQYAADTEAATALLSVGESPRDQSLDMVEHAAFTGICNTILNLDEALTKE